MTADDDAGRVSVELARDVCVGSGYCRRLAPEVFDLDDEGLGVVLTPHPSGSSAAAAREAELSCPSLAISVEPG